MIVAYQCCVDRPVLSADLRWIHFLQTLSRSIVILGDHDSHFKMKTKYDVWSTIPWIHKRSLGLDNKFCSSSSYLQTGEQFQIDLNANFGNQQCTLTIERKGREFFGQNHSLFSYTFHYIARLGYPCHCGTLCGTSQTLQNYYAASIWLSGSVECLPVHSLSPQRQAILVYVS